jgi:hypothetical protein
MKNRTEREWTDGVSVEFCIFKWSRKRTRSEGVGVGFRGDYRAPGAKYEAGFLMRMAVGAALCWPNPGKGLVVNCQGLIYRGGDNFLLWLDVLPKLQPPQSRFNFALIYDSSNASKIRSLIVDQQLEGVLEHCFDNLDLAIDYICRT